MKNLNTALLLAIASLHLTSFAFAQQSEPSASPTDDAAPLKIEGIEVEEASLPGSNKKWMKVICTFTSPVDWVDGLSINFAALVSASGNLDRGMRIVSGGQTYMNVPKGKSQAFMYMSPNATARFGKPLAVNIEVFRGDLPVGSYNWTNGQISPPSEWVTMFPSFQGILQPMRFTPWVMIDSEKTPDTTGF